MSEEGAEWETLQLPSLVYGTIGDLTANLMHYLPEKLSANGKVRFDDTGRLALTIPDKTKLFLPDKLASAMRLHSRTHMNGLSSLMSAYLCPTCRLSQSGFACRRNCLWWKYNSPSG